MRCVELRSRKGQGRRGEGAGKEKNSKEQTGREGEGWVECEKILVCGGGDWRLEARSWELGVCVRWLSRCLDDTIRYDTIQRDDPFVESCEKPYAYGSTTSYNT